MDARAQQRQDRRRWLRAALVVAGLVTGAFLVIFPARIVRALVPAVSPTATVRTVSGGNDKVTSVPLGGAPVAIDVDGDRIPDVDVSVGLTDPAEVPGNPGGPLVPTMTIARDPAAMALTATPLVRPRSPRLQIEVVFSAADLPESTYRVSVGFETPDGGTIPARFQASLLSGLASLRMDPLEAKVLTPGYGAPLRLFSNVGTPSTQAAVSLGYRPLPEELRFRIADAGGRIDYRYTHTSAADTDLEAALEIRGSSGLTIADATVRHLPGLLGGVYRSGPSGGAFSYGASGITQPPDIETTFSNAPRSGAPVWAKARIGALPQTLNVSWASSEGTVSRVDLCAGNEDPDGSCPAPREIGSVDFVVRNFLRASDAPSLPPRLAFPPVDHVQFVSRGLGGSARWVARGHATSIRSLHYDEAADRTKTVHARLGSGTDPFRVGIDMERPSQTVRADSTVSVLPDDMRLTFRPQDDAEPDATPLTLTYSSSVATDVTTHAEIAPAPTTPCREPGTVCLDASVKRLPSTLAATFTKAADHGSLTVLAGTTGAAPADVTADVIAVPASGDGDPIDLHAAMQRFPRRLDAAWHLVDGDPDVVDMQTYDAAGAACTASTPACGIGRVDFRIRNRLDDSLGAAEAATADHLSVVSRDAPARFEVSGQAREIRKLAYRKAGQVAGLNVDIGTGDTFRGHVDIDSAARGVQTIVDSVLDHLPNVMNVCFRAPSDQAPVAAADPSGITSECQREPTTSGGSFWGPLKTTPFSVIYDATRSSAPQAIVKTTAKVLAGGRTPSAGEERADPDTVTSVDTTISKLPGKVGAHILPSKDPDGSCCKGTYGDPLKIAYSASAVIDRVSADFQQRMRFPSGGLAQCEDPRPDASSTCAHAEIEKLPTSLQAQIVTRPLVTAPSTRFQVRTDATGRDTRIGCTGYVAVPGGCQGVVPSLGFSPGVHLAVVRNAGASGCRNEVCGDPVVVDAALEQLPPVVSGRMDQGVKPKPDPAPGASPTPTPSGTAKAPKPDLTDFAVESCAWTDLLAASPSCPALDAAGVGGLRFSMRNFVVPDPLPADVTAGEYFRFVKRNNAFRVSGGLKGFKGAAFSSPGDTAAVRLNTTNVDRTVTAVFDLADDVSSTLLTAKVEHLPPSLAFCYRPNRKIAYPVNGIAEGAFCDVPVSRPPNPVAQRDDNLRLRVAGTPGAGGPVNAFVTFAITDAASETHGGFTALGLPAVMQASAGRNGISFNTPDSTYPVPAGATIDSVRFDVRSFPAGASPSEEPWASQRHFPSNADRSLDDPLAVPASNRTPAPYVSVLSNRTSFQSRGIVNKVGAASMLPEACVYPEGSVTPSSRPTCLHVRAQAGNNGETLGMFLHTLTADDDAPTDAAKAKRTFVTADLGPLQAVGGQPALVDAQIDTSSTNFDPKDKAALTTDRPPLIVIKTCESSACNGTTPAGPTVRAIIEMGRAGALDKAMAREFEDPLFRSAAPPAEPLAETLPPSAPLYDGFYSDPHAREAAADLSDLTRADRTLPPAASARNATAFRIVTVPCIAKCDNPDEGDTVLRGRVKVPFPAALTVSSPVIFKELKTLPCSDNNAPFGTKRKNIAFTADVRGYAGAPLDLGRAVVVLDDQMDGLDHGGEIAIVGSGIVVNGPVAFKLINHVDEGDASKPDITDPDKHFGGRIYIDAIGSLGTGSRVDRLEVRMWSDRDCGDAGFPPGTKPLVLKRVAARSGALVPNLRLNLHNVPSGDWRGRLYLAKKAREDRLEPSCPQEQLLGDVGGLVGISAKTCIDIGNMDFGLDFHPSTAQPTARRVDAVVSLSGGAYAKVSGFASADPAVDSAADIMVRANIRITPLKVNFLAGIKYLAGMSYDLDANLDLNLYAVGQSSFTLGFAKPDHLRLERNAVSNPSAHQYCSPGASQCIQPGVYLLPRFDATGLFGFGRAPVAGVFFGVKRLRTELDLPALTCGFGGLKALAVSPVPEFTNLLGNNNGFALTGGNYSQDLVMNVITGAGLPQVAIIDDTGGLSTRRITALVNAVFCNDSLFTIPKPDRETPSDILPPPGSPANAPAPSAPPAPAPRPGPASLTVPAGQTMYLCGDQGFETVTVEGTLRVSPSAITTNQNGATVPKAGPGGAPLCPAGREGTLRLSAKTLTVAPTGRIDGDAAYTGTPPISLRDDGGRIDFLSGVGTPNGCGGGGGHGGAGGGSACTGSGGSPYGRDDLAPATALSSNATSEPLDTIYPGAAGAPGGAPSGAARPAGGLGGALIDIAADTIDLRGSITARGGGGAAGSSTAATCATGAGGGGGAGGGVMLAAKSLTTANATIAVDGGAGGGGKAGGGGGAGGRIKIASVIPGAPASLSSSAGAGSGGPACGGTTPSPGSVGTYSYTGSVLSKVTGVRNTRTAGRQTTTLWSKASSGVTVDGGSAAGTAAGGPNHEVALCYVYEPPLRTNGSKTLPDAQPLEVPDRAAGESFTNYLRRLNCNFAGAQRGRANGQDLPATFTLGSALSPLADGYYGLFSLAARPKDTNFSIAPTCFPLGLQPNADENGCDFQAVPKAPDVVLGMDTSGPSPSLQASGAFVVAGGKTWTRNTTVNLSASWSDKVGTVTVADEKTNATIFTSCLSNLNGPEQCTGHDPANPNTSTAFRTKVESWPLSSGDGDKSIRLRVDDAAGNTSLTTTTVSLDRTPPTVTIAGPPAPTGGIFTSRPSVTITAADPNGSGVEKIEYFFDRPDAARFVYDPATPPKMPEGTHTLYAQATDKVGNVTATTASYTATVDTQTPRSQVSVLPSGPDGQNGWYRSAPFVAVAAFDAGSGPKTIKVQTGTSTSTLGAEQTVAMTCDARGTSCLSAPIPIGEGTTVVCARTTDKANLVEPLATRPCTSPVRVDSTRPSAAFSAPAPNGTHGWYTTTPSVRITASDTGSGFCAPCPLGDVDATQPGLWTSIDGGAFQLAGASGLTWTPGAGRHDVRWFTVDAAGNRAAMSSRSLAVDASAPSASARLDGSAPNAAGWFRTPVAVLLAATDTDAGVASLRYGVDGPPSPVYEDALELGEGAHGVTYQAKDAAGRSSSPGTHGPFAVDATPPSASAPVMSGSATPGAPVAATYTASDSSSGIARVVVRFFDVTGKHVADVEGQGPGTNTVVWNGRMADGSRVAPGLYYARIVATDAAGNVAASAESAAMLLL